MYGLDSLVKLLNAPSSKSSRGLYHHVKNGIDKIMWFTYYVMMVPSLTSSNLSNQEVHVLTFIFKLIDYDCNIETHHTSVCINNSNILDDIIDILLNL